MKKQDVVHYFALCTSVEHWIGTGEDRGHFSADEIERMAIELRRLEPVETKVDDTAWSLSKVWTNTAGQWAAEGHPGQNSQDSTKPSFKEVYSVIISPSSMGYFLKENHRFTPFECDGNFFRLEPNSSTLFCLCLNSQNHFLR